MNPKCEICQSFLICETDWIGRMFYTHPGKCIPVVYVYEKEEPEEPPEPRQKRCSECGELFTYAPRSPQQVVCGAVCRGVRDYRQKKGREIDREGAWELIKRKRRVA